MFFSYWIIDFNNARKKETVCKDLNAIDNIFTFTCFALTCCTLTLIKLSLQPQPAMLTLPLFPP